MMPKPLEETATILAKEDGLDVRNDGSGHVVSKKLLKSALKGIELDIDDDALIILCHLNSEQSRAVQRYMKDSLRLWLPVLYEEKE